MSKSGVTTSGVITLQQHKPILLARQVVLLVSFVAAFGAPATPLLVVCHIVMQTILFTWMMLAGYDSPNS